MSKTIGGLTPNIIDSLLKHESGPVAEELRNLLNGRLTRLPAGEENDFINSLESLIRDIGAGSGAGEATIAAEVMGALEGGLLIGGVARTAQTFDTIISLVSTGEANQIRENERIRMREVLRSSPDLVERLITTRPGPAGVADIRDNIRESVAEKDRVDKLRNRGRGGRGGRGGRQTPITIDDPPIVQRPVNTGRNAARAAAIAAAIISATASVTASRLPDEIQLRPTFRPTTGPTQFRPTIGPNRRPQLDLPRPILRNKKTLPTGPPIDTHPKTATQIVRQSHAVYIYSKNFLNSSFTPT